MIPTIEYAAEGGPTKLRTRKVWLHILKSTGRFCRNQSQQVCFKTADGDWMPITGGASALAAILSNDDVIHFVGDLEDPLVQQNMWCALLEFKHFLSRLDRPPTPVAHLAPEDRYTRALDTQGRRS